MGQPTAGPPHQRHKPYSEAVGGGEVFRLPLLDWSVNVSGAHRRQKGASEALEPELLRAVSVRWALGLSPSSAGAIGVLNH